MDSDSQRSNANSVISDTHFSRKYKNSGGLSLSNHSASHYQVMTSFIYGSPSKITRLLPSETSFGTVTVTRLLSSVFRRTPEVFIICLFCFLVCGTNWKTSFNKLYKFCFCSELSATLNVHKSLCLTKPKLTNWLKTKKVSLWKKMTIFICLLSTSVMSLLTTLRRWMKLSRMKKKFSLESSKGPVVSNLTSKLFGTLLILSTLFESGHSSLDLSKTTMISTSLNDATLTRSWTMDSFTQGIMMLSTSPTTEAENETIWLSSSLRASGPLSSTQDRASQVLLTSSQSGLKSTVSETRITNVSSSSSLSSSPSPLSSSSPLSFSFTSPSSSPHMNYSSSFVSTLAPPLLSTTLPSLQQSSTVLPSFSSASSSPTVSRQVTLSSLLVSPSLSPSPLPLSSPLSSQLSFSSSLSASSTASIFPLLQSSLLSQSQSHLPSPPRSSSSRSISSLSSLSSSTTLSTSPLPVSSPSAPSSAIIPLPPSPSSPVSSPSAASSAIIPLPPSPSSPVSSPSAASSAILPLPPSPSSPVSSPSAPSSAIIPLPPSPLSPVSSHSAPSSAIVPSSLSFSLSPPPSVLTRSMPPPSVSSSLPVTQLSSSPSLSPASSPSSSLSLLTTSSTLTSASLSSDSSLLPPQSPSSPSAIPSPSLLPSLSSPVLEFSNNVSLKEYTSTVSPLHSLITSNLSSRAVPQAMASATLSATSSASSSVAHVPTRTTPSNDTRIINVTVSLLNEDFKSDLLNRSSAQFMNLFRRVNSTLWDLFSGNVEGLRDIIILRFRNGSVKVDFHLLVNSKSNVTAQAVNQTLLENNGTNNQGFIFGNILVQEKCSPEYCFNSGSCQDSADGPVCSCSTGFVGSRCSQKAVAVDGSYSEWSEFTDCSATCVGGRRRRSRTCTNPPPQHGGKDCRDLGPDVQYIDCNADVSCPVSAEIWIAVGVACGVFLLILIFVVVLLLRRRRKQAEQRHGMSSSKDSHTNGHSTIIPLEVIYEDKTVPKSTSKGQTNPEFIGDDDDDNDIYKAQLLLFLKQAHLIRPNIYPDEQDNQSDTSEHSRSTTRKPSAVSRTSDTTEDHKEQQDHDVETIHKSSSVAVAGKTRASNDEKPLPTTVL